MNTIRRPRTVVGEVALVIFAVAALVTALGGPELLDRLLGPSSAERALNTVRTGSELDASPQPLLRIQGGTVEAVE